MPTFVDGKCECAGVAIVGLYVPRSRRAKGQAPPVCVCVCVCVLGLLENTRVREVRD